MSGDVELWVRGGHPKSVLGTLWVQGLGTAVVVLEGPDACTPSEFFFQLGCFELLHVRAWKLEMLAECLVSLAFSSSFSREKPSVTF